MDYFRFKATLGLKNSSVLNRINHLTFIDVAFLLEGVKCARGALSAIAFIDHEGCTPLGSEGHLASASQWLISGL